MRLRIKIVNCITVNEHLFYENKKNKEIEMVDKKSLSRRGFLKTTLAGASGFLFIASADKKRTDISSNSKHSQIKLIYRTLGKTGITLPVVSMGVMNADNPNLVRAALDSGIVHLDTAYSYQRGKNEEMIGKVIKGRPRDSYIIATKVPGSVPLPYAKGVFPDDEVSKERLAKDFLKRFEISLRRLGLDYVDILHLHNVWTREAALFDPLLKILKNLKKDGKTRFLGISTHRKEPEVIQAAIDSKVYDVVLTSYNFKQDHYLEVKEAIAKAAKSGLGVIGMKTFAGGYLDKKKTKPVNVKAALKWVLQDPNVHTVIPGFTTFDQMNLDLSIMEDMSLSDSEKKDLKLEASLQGLYCLSCESCQSQCPRHLPIPDIMRAYMYAYGYRNLEAAQDLLSSMSLDKNICDDCKMCYVKCVKGFNVSKRIHDISRLQQVPSEFIT